MSERMSDEEFDDLTDPDGPMRQLAIEARCARKAEAGLREQTEMLLARVEELRGLRPELPPRPSIAESLPGEVPPLKRYGLRWNGPTEPLAVPMLDGYWTPYHLAARALAAERARAEMAEQTREENGRLRAALAGFVRKAELEERILQERRALRASHGGEDSCAPWWDADHACAECVPGGELVREGFRCALHAAKALLGQPEKEKEA